MTAAESHPPPIPVSSELHEFLEQAVSENKARYEKEANKKSLWDVGNQVVLLVPLLFNYLVAGFYKTLLISWMIHYSVDVLQKVTKQNTTWPPALLALGVLTIISLIVHPDGYTWVILQQLRCVFFFTRVWRGLFLFCCYCFACAKKENGRDFGTSAFFIFFC